MKIYTWDGEIMRRRTWAQKAWKRFTHGVSCIALAWSIWKKPWERAASDDPFDNISLQTALVVAWGIWK